MTQQNLVQSSTKSKIQQNQSLDSKLAANDHLDFKRSMTSKKASLQTLQGKNVDDKSRGVEKLEIQQIQENYQSGDFNKESAGQEPFDQFKERWQRELDKSSSKMSASNRSSLDEDDINVSFKGQLKEMPEHQWRRTIQVKLSELKSRNDVTSQNQSQSHPNQKIPSLTSSSNQPSSSFQHGDTQIQIDNEQMENDLNQNSQAVVGFDDALIELQMQAQQLSEAVLVNQNSQSDAERQEMSATQLQRIITVSEEQRKVGRRLSLKDGRDLLFLAYGLDKEAQADQKQRVEKRQKLRKGVTLSNLSVRKSAVGDQLKNNGSNQEKFEELIQDERGMQNCDAPLNGQNVSSVAQIMQIVEGNEESGESDSLQTQSQGTSPFTKKEKTINESQKIQSCQDETQGSKSSNFRASKATRLQKAGSQQLLKVIKTKIHNQVEESQKSLTSKMTTNWNNLNPKFKTHKNFNYVQFLLRKTKNERSKAETLVLVQYFVQVKVFKDMLLHNKQLNPDGSFALTRQDEENFQMLVNAMTIETMPEGKLIFREGDEGQTFYITLEGEVEILKAVRLPITGAYKSQDDHEKLKCYFECLIENFEAIHWPNMEIPKSEMEDILGIEYDQKSGDATFLPWSKYPVKKRRLLKAYTKLHEKDKTSINMSGQPTLYVNRRLVFLGAGAGFGEMALIGDEKRMATIVTNSNCIFAKMSKIDFKLILRKSLRRKMSDQVSFLSKFSIFEGLSHVKLQRILYLLSEQDLIRNQVIFKQGDENIDGVYFIQSGEIIYEMRQEVEKEGGNSSLLETDDDIKQKMNVVKTGIWTQPAVLKNSLSKQIETKQVAIFAKNELIGFEEILRRRMLELLKQEFLEQEANAYLKDQPKKVEQLFRDRTTHFRNYTAVVKSQTAKVFHLKRENLDQMQKFLSAQIMKREIDVRMNFLHNQIKTINQVRLKRVTEDTKREMLRKAKITREILTQIKDEEKMTFQTERVLRNQQTHKTAPENKKSLIQKQGQKANQYFTQEQHSFQTKYLTGQYEDQTNKQNYQLKGTFAQRKNSEAKNGQLFQNVSIESSGSKTFLNINDNNFKSKIIEEKQIGKNQISQQKVGRVSLQEVSGRNKLIKLSGINTPGEQLAEDSIVFETLPDHEKQLESRLDQATTNTVGEEAVTFQGQSNMDLAYQKFPAVMKPGLVNLSMEVNKAYNQVESTERIKSTNSEYKQDNQFQKRLLSLPNLHQTQPESSAAGEVIHTENNSILQNMKVKSIKQINRNFSKIQSKSSQRIQNKFQPDFFQTSYRDNRVDSEKNGQGQTYGTQSLTKRVSVAFGMRNHQANKKQSSFYRIQGNSSISLNKEANQRVYSPHLKYKFSVDSENSSNKKPFGRSLYDQSSGTRSGNIQSLQQSHQKEQRRKMKLQSVGPAKLPLGGADQQEGQEFVQTDFLKYQTKRSQNLDSERRSESFNQQQDYTGMIRTNLAKLSHKEQVQLSQMRKAEYNAYLRKQAQFSGNNDKKEVQDSSSLKNYQNESNSAPLKSKGKLAAEYLVLKDQNTQQIISSDQLKSPRKKPKEKDFETRLAQVLDGIVTDTYDEKANLRRLENIQQKMSVLIDSHRQQIKKQERNAISSKQVGPAYNKILQQRKDKQKQLKSGSMSTQQENVKPVLGALTRKGIYKSALYEKSGQQSRVSSTSVLKQRDRMERSSDSPSMVIYSFDGNKRSTTKASSSSVQNKQLLLEQLPYKNAYQLSSSNATKKHSNPLFRQQLQSVYVQYKDGGKVENEHLQSSSQYQLATTLAQNLSPIDNQANLRVQRDNQHNQQEDIRVVRRGLSALKKGKTSQRQHQQGSSSSKQQVEQMDLKGVEKPLYAFQANNKLVPSGSYYPLEQEFQSQAARLMQHVQGGVKGSTAGDSLQISPRYQHQLGPQESQAGSNKKNLVSGYFDTRNFSEQPEMKDRHDLSTLHAIGQTVLREGELEQDETLKASQEKYSQIHAETIYTQSN